MKTGLKGSIVKAFQFEMSDEKTTNERLIESLETFKQLGFREEWGKLKKRLIDDGVIEDDNWRSSKEL